MLQRVQTLYLLTIVVLYVQMFLFPLVKFTGEDLIELNAFEISNGEKVLPLTILLGAIILLAIVSVFLFKKRILQIRLTFIALVLMIGSIVLIYFYVYQIMQGNHFTPHYQFPCIYPMISIILAYLAIRAIGKDEALVRSIDRLR